MREFGVSSSGRSAYLYTIENARGMRALITDFGAALVCLFVPDQNGHEVDVVLGFDTLAEYEENPPYLGVTVGRFANRIVRGQFSLEGREYRLDCNDGVNHLHGGLVGFDKRLWNASQTSSNAVTFALFSPDMDQGYPGNIIVSVRYEITDENALQISYSGLSDKATLLSLTNHSYFNLAGQGAHSIYDQHLRIDADQIAPIDANGSVTGEMMDVSGTPFDFRSGKKIGADIGADHPQIQYASGFDHHFFLNHSGSAAAEAYCEKTGISMALITDRPGVQLYTGNFLTEGMPLKGGHKATKNRAFCLETQLAPDAVNKPQFGDNAVLPAGACAHYQTSYVFSTKRPSWV